MATMSTGTLTGKMRRLALAIIIAAHATLSRFLPRHALGVVPDAAEALTPHAHKHGDEERIDRGRLEHLREVYDAAASACRQLHDAGYPGSRRISEDELHAEFIEPACEGIVSPDAVSAAEKVECLVAGFFGDGGPTWLSVARSCAVPDGYIIAACQSACGEGVFYVGDCIATLLDCYLTPGKVVQCGWQSADAEREERLILAMARNGREGLTLQDLRDDEVPDATAEDLQRILALPVQEREREEIFDILTEGAPCGETARKMLEVLHADLKAWRKKNAKLIEQLQAPRAEGEETPPEYDDDNLAIKCYVSWVLLALRDDPHIGIGQSEWNDAWDVLD